MACQRFDGDGTSPDRKQHEPAIKILKELGRNHKYLQLPSLHSNLCKVFAEAFKRQDILGLKAGASGAASGGTTLRLSR
jgi:hypothetical protein